MHQPDRKSGFLRLDCCVDAAWREVLTRPVALMANGPVSQPSQPTARPEVAALPLRHRHASRPLRTVGLWTTDQLPRQVCEFQAAALRPENGSEGSPGHGAQRLF